MGGRPYCPHCHCHCRCCHCRCRCCYCHCHCRCCCCCGGGVQEGALGASHPEDLKLEWTRFDHKPAVAWRVADPPIMFSYLPPLGTGGEDKKVKAFEPPKPAHPSVVVRVWRMMCPRLGDSGDGVPWHFRMCRCGSALQRIA